MCLGQPSRVPGGPTPAVRNWGSKCSRSSMNDSSGVAGMPISARPVGDGFVEPDLLGEAACLTRPGSVVRDGTSDRRACSWVSPSRQWLRSLALLVGERLELCPFRDEVGDQHGCCSGPGTGSRRAAGPRPDAADQGAIRGTFCRWASGARECRSPTVRLLSIPARAAAPAWARTDLGHVLSPRDQEWGRWMCRLSCLVCRIPLNRSGISATACFRGCSLSLPGGRLPARE